MPLGSSFNFYFTIQFLHFDFEKLPKMKHTNMMDRCFSWIRKSYCLLSVSKNSKALLCFLRILGVINELIFNWERKTSRRKKWGTRLLLPLHIYLSLVWCRAVSSRSNNMTYHISRHVIHSYPKTCVYAANTQWLFHSFYKEMDRFQCVYVFFSLLFLFRLCRIAYCLLCSSLEECIAHKRRRSGKRANNNKKRMEREQTKESYLV